MIAATPGGPESGPPRQTPTDEYLRPPHLGVGPQRRALTRERATMRPSARRKRSWRRSGPSMYRHLRSPRPTWRHSCEKTAQRSRPIARPTTMRPHVSPQSENCGGASSDYRLTLRRDRSPALGPGDWPNLPMNPGTGLVDYSRAPFDRLYRSMIEVGPRTASPDHRSRWCPAVSPTDSVGSVTGDSKVPC